MKKVSWSLTYILEKIDLFKKDLPNFSLKGKQQIPSVTGGVSTAIIIVVMLTFALTKLDQLLKRDNPNVSTFTEELALGSSDVINLKDTGIRFAWSIEGYSDKKIKDDPRFVKTYVRLSGRRQGESQETMLDYHRCTWEDFESFAPPSNDAMNQLNSIMSDEGRGLYCLDWEKLGEILEIWGISQYDDFQYIELVMTPCQYIHDWLGWDGDSIDPDCVWDKQAQMDYVGNMMARVYIEDQVFQVN